MIIGQVKLYNPDNYPGLISSLRAEVGKCKKNRPDRYILCLGSSLSPQQAIEILDLFEGYIQCEEDIVDGIKLNKYINQPEYERLKEVYSTLLVPDLTYVEHIIDRVVNRRTLNNTEELFEKIRERHCLYYNTLQYRKVLEKLNEDRIVIITGNPGVGKTTTAEMIIQQLLVRTWDHVYKLDKVLDIRDLFLKNKKQLFFVDDFWGSQMEKKITNRDYLKQFVEVIDMIRRNEQHYLIMTSRTYIVQSVLNYAEEEVQQAVNLNNYTILLEGYSPDDIAKIFLNHLLFYNCNRDIFEYFRYGHDLELIIEHANYSPRHIEYFFKYIYYGEMNGYEFNKALHKYLNKPHEYWRKVLNLQSDTARLILILLLVSSDPIRKEDLKISLNSVCSHINLNMDIQLLIFEEELRTLENLFITSEEDEEGAVWVQFNSPGIKDYVLEYLRGNIDCWGAPLILGACFFNQLYYVFDTKQRKLDDFGAEVPLSGMKIVLSPELQLVLKNKILQDFDCLILSTGLFCEITDELNYMNLPDELEYFKFRVLSQLFSLENNADVRDFIVGRVKRNIQLCHEGRGGMPTESMLRFPYLLRDLQPFLETDPLMILTTFHNNIRFAVEYTYFYELKEIYPKEFAEYLTKHLKEFRKHIRKLIIEDILYYEGYEDDWKIDSLIDSDIEELQKKYGIRLNKKFVDEIEYYSGKTFHRLGRLKKITGKRRKQKPTVPNEKGYGNASLAEKLVSSYIEEPEVEIDDPAKFIRRNCPDKNLRQQLLAQIETAESPVHGFLYTSYSAFVLIEYLSVSEAGWEYLSGYSFLHHFAVSYFNRLRGSIPVDKVAALFRQLALEHFLSGGYFRHLTYYTDLQIRQFLKKNAIECADLNYLYPFFVKIKKWYTFLNYELLLYFVTQAIIRIKETENYVESIADITGGEERILGFVQEADFERFKKEILDVEMCRFLNTLNRSSSWELVLSFLIFFNPTIELTWNRKNNTFESESVESEEYFVEELIRFTGVEFEAMGVEVFFSKDFYWGENLRRFKLYKQGYPNLYNKLLSVFGLISGAGKLSESSDKVFELNVYQFAENEDNYEALKGVGFEDYILAVYREIQLKVKEYAIDKLA